MEKLDSMILQDIKEQMYLCTGLAVRFVSLVADFGNVDNPECREILKELMCTMIMEGEAQRVLSFLSVPVRFVLGEEADKVLNDAREVLESMEISTEDRLIGGNYELRFPCERSPEFFNYPIIIMKSCLIPIYSLYFSGLFT